MAIPVIIPKQGQSVETCVIIEWYVKKGEPVSKGDLLYTFETDKSSFDEEAPADGVLLDIFYNSGDEVPVLTTVAVIGKEGENIEDLKPQVSEARGMKSEAGSLKTEGRSVDASPNSVDASSNGEIKISPKAKKLADKMNISYNLIKGTGPGGRISESDVEEFIKTQDTSIKTQDLSQNISKDGNGEWEIRKLSNVRQIISDKIYASLQNSAQLTHHLSADATKIIDYRNKIKKLQETTDIGDITLNDLICYAVVKALKKKPEINSHFLGDSIKTFKKVHLGFAVETERGLMVPVIRNADDLDINELSKQFKTLAEKCRKGNIEPDLLDSTSATFTVSNLGAYGIEMFTPILNLPQAGILGINTIIQRPVYKEKEKIEIIPYVGLSLTYDHRAIDGAPASDFLKEVKEQIENINVMM